jgi:hypothetical protein
MLEGPETDGGGRGGGDQYRTSRCTLDVLTRLGRWGRAVVTEDCIPVNIEPDSGSAAKFEQPLDFLERQIIPVGSPWPMVVWDGRWCHPCRSSSLMSPARWRRLSFCI